MGSTETHVIFTYRPNELFRRRLIQKYFNLNLTLCQKFFASLACNIEPYYSNLCKTKVMRYIADNNYSLMALRGGCYATWFQNLPNVYCLDVFSQKIPK